MNPQETEVLENIQDRLDILRKLLTESQGDAVRTARLQKEYDTSWQQYLTAFGRFTGDGG
jgi:hypothetical protein